MKRIRIPLVILAGMLAGHAKAQQGGSGEAFEAEITREAREAPVELQPEKANETKIGGFGYSGILIEALKAQNILQIFDPFVPPKGSSPEDNVVWDPIQKRVAGLKLFSIEF